MAKKKKKNVATGPEWSVCRVSGYIVACDPGHQNLTPYPAEYKRKDLSVRMNLCSHCEHLPPVIVRAIEKDHIVINYFGCDHRLDTGKWLQTPRVGLSYAYSEAMISLD